MFAKCLLRVILADGVGRRCGVKLVLTLIMSEGLQRRNSSSKCGPFSLPLGVTANYVGH